ncbi:MAG: hypothetical protein U5J83_17820 [Bryobacterales bacterium]|nr:hypothetical protein [Bryobacterales bacterium]
MTAEKSFFGGICITDRRTLALRTIFSKLFHATGSADRAHSQLLGRRKRRTEAPGGGDAGWDVSIVKGFCDSEFPWLIALGNCATGRTDWKRKGMEVQPTLFWNFFEHQHLSVFVTFFAVPFVMDHDMRLRKLLALKFNF